MATDLSRACALHDRASMPRSIDYARSECRPRLGPTRSGISFEAIELYLASDVIDLHVDSFIWTRVLRLRPRRRHGRGLLGARYYSQVDFPRMREARVGGALWSITTNPLRRARGRAAAFAKNLARSRRSSRALPATKSRSCATSPSYRAARAAGKHAVLVAIQGGNALDRDARARRCSTTARSLAVTLVHLSQLARSARRARRCSRGDDGLSASRGART